MNIEDIGVLLEKKKLGEKSLIVKIFSKNNGLLSGAVNNASSKQVARSINPGNLISFNWQARLVEHLGVFRFELVKPISFKIFSSPLKMHLIQSMLAILTFALPEGVIESNIYDKTVTFIDMLADRDDSLMDYLEFEIDILSELGFKIDITSCAVTNSLDNLYYISPRTGRSVIKEVGDPYREKLFVIPDFFNKRRSINYSEMLHGMSITGYFLQKNIFNLKNAPSPKARENLINYLQSYI
jgi:DNA repair protein RecO (recombination protein O)